MSDRLNLTGLAEAPAWGKVLLAARLVRRAVLALPGVDEEMREQMEAACVALERCARDGGIGPAERAQIGHGARAAERAGRWSDGVRAGLSAAIDTAHAAENAAGGSRAGLDCEEGFLRTFRAIKGAAGLNAVQVHLALAADLDLLRFACGEADVGEAAGGLGAQVIGRMFPLHAPEHRVEPQEEDPTGGAR